MGNLITETLTTSSEKTVEIDIVSAVLNYVGTAIPGTATSAAKWKLQELRFNVGGDLISNRFANGSHEYVHIYNDRAGFTYT